MIWKSFCCCKFDDPVEYNCKIESLLLLLFVKLLARLLELFVWLLELFVWLVELLIKLAELLIRLDELMVKSLKLLVRLKLFKFCFSFVFLLVGDTLEAR